MTTVSKKRHLLKAFTWRFIASLTTFIIGWFVSGDMKIGLTVGAFDIVIKLIVYYFHERVWYTYILYGIEKES